MLIDPSLTPASLTDGVARVLDAAERKSVRVLDAAATLDGAPVLTTGGRWAARGWTEWTLGFTLGLPLLVHEQRPDPALFSRARAAVLAQMPSLVTHHGVHDHGFQIVSTYGTLLRLAAGPHGEPRDRDVCTLALRVSGAVQAARWTATSDGDGFIHSFNGPHSLFVDTMRTLRSLALAHALGQELRGEHDGRVDLLHRLVAHAAVTARYAVYYGEGRDAWDVPGRTAHESLFHPVTGVYRCPSTQQGWSPFSTWTRGLAWALLGCSEQLVFLRGRAEEEFPLHHPKADTLAMLERAARATAERYIIDSCIDGLTYWDTMAPGLSGLQDWRARPSEPWNGHEPVDSSAAVIAAQGFLRLADALASVDAAAGERYRAAACTIARTLCSDAYLAPDGHDGLVLHGVYHRPAGWDAIPAGQRIPCGEAVIWGDYHLVELAGLLRDAAEGRPLVTFHRCLEAM